jgi:nickel superoxide dismutase
MKRTLLAAVVAAAVFAPRPGLAHCQMPCGIYDDPARIAQMKEDAATIAKAVTTLTELAGKTDAQSWNQAIRWTTTKEEHASDIIDIVAEYFLTQKVKPVAPGAEGYDVYLANLADHHAVMVAAMKVKQTVSAESVAALQAAIDALAKRY